MADIIWGRLAMTTAGRLLHPRFRLADRIPGRCLLGGRGQYSVGDYVVTFLSFLGMATPSFLLALFVMYMSVKYLGYSVGGLFSPEFCECAVERGAGGSTCCSILWIPVFVLGVAGIAALVRIMRANLLDELGKPYVETGRAKGLPRDNPDPALSDARGPQSFHQHRSAGFCRCSSPAT